MAIRIGSNIEYSGSQFLDLRQGKAKTKDDLKTWSEIIPTGFMVCLDTGDWYSYQPNKTIRPDTGKFWPLLDLSEDEIWDEFNRLQSEFTELVTRMGTVEAEFSTLSQEFAQVMAALAMVTQRLQEFYQVKLRPANKSISLDTLGNISVNLNPSDKILSVDSRDGLKSDISVVKIPQASNSPYTSQYKVVGKDGITALGETISILKDQLFKECKFLVHATQADKQKDPSVIIGDPYLKFIFPGTDPNIDVALYVPIKPLLESEHISIDVTYEEYRTGKTYEDYFIN